MTPVVEIVDVNPIVLALTEARVKQSEIPARIRGMFDIVYAWLRSSEVSQTGHNYAVYDQFRRTDMRMRVGFPVSDRFQDTDRVVCAEFPGGRAVHTVHRGPYHQLHAAHARLNEWCAQNAIVANGMSWEVYGDWHEDESKLETDIYVLVT